MKLPERWLGFVIGSSGWALLATYVLYEYSKYRSVSGLWGHYTYADPMYMIYHALILLAPVLSMLFGFLVNRRLELQLALQKSEESLSMAQQVANVGSWDWNIQEDTLTWSDQTYRHFGLEPGEITPAHKTLKKFTHPDDIETVNRSVELALRGEEPYSVDVRMLRKDGTEWIMHTQGTVYRDNKGKAVRFVGTQQDITERKEAEGDLKKAYEELKTLDELKTDVISNVSHELRTPLTIIRGALELAKDEENPDKKNGLLNTALDALARQDNVIGDLVGASTMTETREDLKLGSVDLVNVATIIEGEFEPILKKEKIKFKMQIKDDLPKVSAEHDKLEHILRNLISNAIKFNKKGGSITIEAAKKRDVVETCVTDTGIGIPEDKLNKIFGRLYQIDSSSGRSYGGTGLGLAIVKEMVEIQGGRVRVKSTLKKGSTFCFTLPIDKDK